MIPDYEARDFFGERPLCTKEAAHWLNMSVRNLLELSRTGQIPATKRGRRWYYSRRKLAEWAGVAD